MDQEGSPGLSDINAALDASVISRHSQKASVLRSLREANDATGCATTSLLVVGPSCTGKTWLILNLMRALGRSDVRHLHPGNLERWAEQLRVAPTGFFYLPDAQSIQKGSAVLDQLIKLAQRDSSYFGTDISKVHLAVELDSEWAGHWGQIEPLAPNTDRRLQHPDHQAVYAALKPHLHPVQYNYWTVVEGLPLAKMWLQSASAGAIDSELLNRLLDMSLLDMARFRAEVGLQQLVVDVDPSLASDLEVVFHNGRLSFDKTIFRALFQTREIRSAVEDLVKRTALTDSGVST